MESTYYFISGFILGASFVGAAFSVRELKNYIKRENDFIKFRTEEIMRMRDNGQYKE